MKKIGSLILTAAMAAALITGCGNKITSETSAPASNAGTSTTAADNAANAKTFEQLYGNQLPRYMNLQYYFDGKAIMKQEANFYYINAFSDLTAYAQMGYCPSTSLGYIDLDANYSGADYNTYGDYFVYYAENSLESTLILCDRAEKEGITLKDETKKSIDDMMTEITNTTAPAAGLSVKEYLQLHYGPGMDEESFRKVIERYYLADTYAQHYCTKPEITASLQAKKDAALASANKMKDACKTLEDLAALAADAQAAGDVLDQGELDVPKGQMVAKFEEWAYGENRKEGELDVIYAPEYGYFVVGYKGINPETNVPVVRYALFSAPENDQEALQIMSEELLQEIKANKHDFHKKEKSGSMEPTDVLIVVFFTLAGVAIVIVIVILVNNALNNKNGKNNSNGKKPAKKPAEQKPKVRKVVDDEEDDDDEE